MSGPPPLPLVRRLWWKRPFDLIVLILIAIPAGVLAAAVAVLVRVRLGRPVLFSQWRPGRGGRPFLLRKFRTMRSATAGRDTDADRLTPFGSWLRSTSLDELPELWNVATGDMSFVGPRPLLMEYLPLYDAEQVRRMDVPPGLTGWAQVNGRNTATWPERFRHDLWYVERASPWLDLRILAMTIPVVVRRHGVNQPDRPTMERFRGNP